VSEHELSAKGRARRDAILATALDVLADRGYRDTSLRAIGRALGIQPAHILHYFPSREALLEEVIGAWDTVPADIAGREGTMFIDRWLAVVERNATIPGLVHLYTAFAAEAADPNHPSHDYFRRRYRRVRGWLEEDLAEGRDAGRYRTTLPDERIAAILVSLSDGLQLQWLIDPTVDMVGELAAAFSRLTDSELPPPYHTAARSLVGSPQAASS
jgi:AcrR family transcriptional regulator